MRQWLFEPRSDGRVTLIWLGNGTSLHLPTVEIVATIRQAMEIVNAT